MLELIIVEMFLSFMVCNQFIKTVTKIQWSKIKKENVFNVFELIGWVASIFALGWLFYQI